MRKTGSPRLLLRNHLQTTGSSHVHTCQWIFIVFFSIQYWLAYPKKATKSSNVYNLKPEVTEEIQLDCSQLDSVAPEILLSRTETGHRNAEMEHSLLRSDQLPFWMGCQNQFFSGHLLTDSMVPRDLYPLSFIWLSTHLNELNSILAEQSIYIMGQSSHW